MTADLVIRGGIVVDGTGRPAYQSDVSVEDGVVVSIGNDVGRARRELDADGCIVTPGFVDIHTHYDGQATWTGSLAPSSLHGVTTAVTGNCGVGFAPCRPEDRDRLVRLMEGVEDIPGAVLTEGIPWAWETFPEYLDFLEARKYDIDIAVQLAHGPLRVYVMGERGANREPATDDEVEQMAALAREAIEAGAIGFSTDRTLNHRTADGDPVPTYGAREYELVRIASAIGTTGRGSIELASDFSDPAAELQMLRHVSLASGRPLTFGLTQIDSAPESWRQALDVIGRMQEDGLDIKGQVFSRPVGVILGLQLSLNPFSRHPTYLTVADLPVEERVTYLRRPDVRAQLIAEDPVADDVFMQSVLSRAANIYRFADPPNYEPDPDDSLGAEAARTGRAVMDVVLDAMLEDNGRALLFFPFLNYADGCLDATREMIEHHGTVMGLGDGGAHVAMICDASQPTFMLTHWVRDRRRGQRMSLEATVRRLSSEAADAVGLGDRGRLEIGRRADFNVIDFERLTLHRPDVLSDLPAGGRRLMQRATGYRYTAVAGELTLVDDQLTGARPGRLVRPGRSS